MIRALLLGLLGAASFAAVYVALGPGEPETDVATVTEAPAATASVEAPAAAAGAAFLPSFGDPASFELRLDAGGAAAPSGGAATETRAVRDVTPSNMTAAPPVTGALTRVGAPATAPPVEARFELLFNPVVVSADTIKAGDREIRLAGIDAPDADAQCGAGNDAWPCGTMARAALRRFIRGRAIGCEVPSGADDIPEWATCRVGDDDLSEWLVAQGWAKRAGDAFADAEETARKAKLGLWSETRPDQAAEVAASD